MEAALRSREMNRDEAQELLSQVRPLDQWRRHDAHSGYDLGNQATTAPAYPRFNHVAQQMSFPPVSQKLCTSPAEHLSWWKLAIKLHILRGTDISRKLFFLLSLLLHREAGILS